MRVLLTGGAGFIGSHVIKSLLDRGNIVVCVDNFNNYYDPKLKEYRIRDFKDNENFKLYKIDIRNFKDMNNVFLENKIDKIVHLAAMAGVRSSLKEPNLYADVNINGTINLLELAKKYKIKNFIFASSSSVYGSSTEIPFSEKNPINTPISPYGVTKHAGELLCHTYHHLYKIPITCLRFFTVYGPKGRPDMSLYKFTKLINDEKEIPVFGYGNMKRNFTYISDIVDGIIASLDKNLDFEIINLGGSKTTDLITFIEFIENKIGKKAKKKFLEMQPGDVKVTLADCSKAERLLDYKPKVEIEKGIQLFVEWFKKYNNTHDTYIYQKTICVVGLGYVGFPLIKAFAKYINVIGFDINEQKIKILRSQCNNIKITSNPAEIKKADIVIMAIPTPITKSKEPDLSHVISASKLVGQNLKKDTIVVLESTVYPGVTEDVVGPILEQESKMVLGRDFKIAYSPERVNPGDEEHTIDKITKIVAGMDKETTQILADLYGLITNVYITKDIKTAEAAKVIENIQRDLNIALINEIALIFNKMGLDTNDVLDAAATKWNFHMYNPGMVGGHCIPVDPYYLVYKAKELGYYPQVILAGRNINDYMSKHIAEITVKALNNARKVIKGSNVLIMGLTYKENLNDTRETPVKTMIKELKEYEINIFGYDPLLTIEKIKEFGITPMNFKTLNNKTLDCIIITTTHESFKKVTLEQLKKTMVNKPILIDVKRIYKKKQAQEHGFIYKTL